MCRITLIIHVQRAAPKRYCSVIYNGAQFGSDFLSDQTGECRRFLSVEIRFQTMTNRFVQENPRPAWSEDNFHWACGRIDSSELKNCLPSALPRNCLRVEIPSKDIEPAAAAAPLISRLSPAALFSDAHHVQPDQWLKIPCSIAVRSDN